jgi:glycosyltransferase involved in cell wall biosynthesis
MKPLFSIVIPALNSRLSAGLTLRCLEGQYFDRVQFESILIDDGSTDGTRQHFVDSSTSGFRYLRHSITQGRSAARNTGWRNSSGEIIVFLDADMLPHPDLLRSYQAAFESGAEVVSGARYCVDVDPKRADLHDQLAALCQCSVSDLMLREARKQFSALHTHALPGPYPQPVWARWECFLRDLVRERPDSLLCGYAFVGSNVAVRRSLLEATNGFDLFLPRGEDTDLGIRLFNQGARFQFADDAIAYHEHRAAPLDRAMSFDQYISFFHRHPYRDVLLTYVWFTLNAQAPPASPPFDILKDLMASHHDDCACTRSETFRMGARALSVCCEHSAGDLAAYYGEVYGISAAAAADYLDEAVARGVYVLSKGGVKYFDVHVTTNWLAQHTTFQQSRFLNISYARLHKTPFQLSGQPEDLAAWKCMGRYEVKFQGTDPNAQIDSVLAIPAPVSHLNQTGLRFTGCSPPDLLDYLEPQSGITRYPWKSSASNECSVSYEFVSVMREQSASAVPQSVDRALPVPGHLAAVYPGALTSRVDALRKQILGETSKYDWTTAKMLYLWVLDNTRLFETALPDFTVLNTGFGACMHQARLFIALCRSAGIPAREQCGALVGREGDPQAPLSLETKTVEFSPFAHTWAECYLASEGWIPVEFVGWGQGKRAVNARNVTDAALRGTLISETDFYDDYYFGSLDPYRVYGPVSANRIHTRLELKSGAGARPRRLQCGRAHHRLTCRFTNVSA